jgi:hypothetical protein
MSEQEQVDALEAAVAKVADDLATATTTLQDELNTLAEQNPGVDLTALTAAIGNLDPAVEALAALKPASEPTPAPDKPVYVHNQADGPTEGWTASGFEVPAVPATTGPEGEAIAESPAVPLWYFDADAVGGEPTGAVEGVWTVYTGPTEPVPAAE